MSIANEALVNTFLHSCITVQEENPIDTFCRLGFVLHDANTGRKFGRDRVRAVIEALNAAFPDAQIWSRESDDDGEVRSLWRWAGTHRGELMGIPATGKRVVVSGGMLCHVANGLIDEAWLMFDTSAFFRLIEESVDELPSSHVSQQADKPAPRPGYREIEVKSWRTFVDTVTAGAFRNWVFRGQADADWEMFSSLSRYLTKWHVHRSLWDEHEERIIRIFRRKAHLFLQHLPDRDDTFEWVALMQHHGAPTRLLDATWSPYVAAFFALEQSDRKAAVWAINSGALLAQRRHAELLPEKVIDGIHVQPSINPRVKGVFERVYLPGAVPIVGMADPYMMNQRLIAQQGTFLIPGLLDEPVESVLARYASSEVLLAKFILYPEVRDDAMRELLNMNITNATLFPGLDGLARSMMYELEFNYEFDVHSGELRP